MTQIVANIKLQTWLFHNDTLRVCSGTSGDSEQHKRHHDVDLMSSEAVFIGPAGGNKQENYYICRGGQRHKINKIIYTTPTIMAILQE